MIPLEFARDLSKNRHKHQFYGDKPYLFHLQQVENNIVKMKEDIFNSFPLTVYENALVLANLHDIVEDNHATVGEIRALFGDIIGDAIELISKKEYESYYEYLERINYRIDRFNMPIAMLVKIADLKANLLNTKLSLSIYGTKLINNKLSNSEYDLYKRAFKRKEKYDFALYYVETEIYKKTGFSTNII